MSAPVTPPAPDVPPRRRLLGEVLVAEGVIEPEDLERAIAERALSGKGERLGRTLRRLGMCDDHDIAHALAHQMHLPLADGHLLAPDPRAVAAVPAALARRHRILPVSMTDGVLTIATSDPSDVMARDDIGVATGARRVEMVVAATDRLAAAIRRAYPEGAAAAELISEIGEDTTDDADLPDEETAPLVALVDGLLAQAAREGASDIHLEPGRGGLLVRFRIDGVLATQVTIPRHAQGQVLSRVKVIGGMDIAERRLPQDGRARIIVDGKRVDLRLSSMPGLHGEVLVARLLRATAERAQLEDIGMDPEDLAILRAELERPQGLVLTTGPTGSGKTSTLYAALSHLAEDSRNVITLEDPIEYELGGVNQTQIEEKIGRTFARCLRTVLRQDPDVVLVGEIRDHETGELAAKAALTGHLVLSSLHTNDAPGALTRMRDLGMPAYLVAASLSLVIAQRLVRELCPECSSPGRATPRQLALLDLHGAVAEQEYAYAEGCAACQGTGYVGRFGLFQVMPVTSSLRELLVAGASEAEIRQNARAAGMRTLREAGLLAAAQHRTSLEELIRVTPANVDGEEGCRGCGRATQPDFAVCPWCATDLSPPQCERCDRVLDPRWAVCPGCGCAAIALLPPTDSAAGAGRQEGEEGAPADETGTAKGAASAKRAGAPKRGTRTRGPTANKSELSPA